MDLDLIRDESVEDEEPASAAPSLPERQAFRIELALIAMIAALMAFSDAGWASILLSPLGIGGEELLRALASPWVMGSLAILFPLWWHRSSHWANGHEAAFWGQGTTRKAAFLLIHWPLPLAALLGLAIAREAWDRMPKDQAVISHRRFFRMLYGTILAVSIALNVSAGLVSGPGPRLGSGPSPMNPPPLNPSAPAPASAL